MKNKYDNPFGEYPKLDLTKEEAESIQEWRVYQDYSWRAVAREFYDKYPDRHKVVRSNQLSGIQLCESARKYFKEKIEDGWN